MKGRDAFYAEETQCAKCHAMDGKGATIGPNLSNLRHRDYQSVLRDISQPSYAINPDFLTYNVLLEDGRSVSGVVRSEGERLRIGDTKGIELVVTKDEVTAMKPGTISTMPEGLLKTIPPEKLRDLLTFLLLAPPEELRPAPITRPGAPPPRKRKEVEAILAGSEKIDLEKLKPLSVVLVAGPKDHGENEHDYPDWQKRWSKLLPLAPKVSVSTADAWPSAEQLKTADVLVFYSANPAWSPEKAKELDAFQARGGGMVFLHFAVNGQRAPDQLAERIGLAWENGKSKFRHGALDLKFVADSKHPILRNFEKAHFEDESYWDLLGDQKSITLLASGDEDGQAKPLMWAYERGKGRVFVSILGHYSWTFDDPLFRTLVLRGIAWSARENVDRFNDVVQLGARVE
jgi:putative heme-binding domain-containing protein